MEKLVKLITRLRIYILCLVTAYAKRTLPIKSRNLTVDEGLMAGVGWLLYGKNTAKISNL